MLNSTIPTEFSAASRIGKHADTATIRVLRPLAKSVTILTQDGEYPMTHEYNGVFVVTVPASGTKKQPTIPDYRVRTEWESGAVLIEDDPYRYMPTVGDMDTYLFGEGRHEKLWETLGAHVLRYDDPMGGADGTPGEQVVGTAFSVWAPNAHAVRVVGNFNAWDGRRHAMRELGSSGVWRSSSPESRGRDLQVPDPERQLHVEMKADPMERQHEVPPNTASIVTESTYKWNDDAWMQHRRTTNPHDGPVSIYEVHAGSWRQGLTTATWPSSSWTTSSRKASPTWSSCHWPSTRSPAPGAIRSPATMRSTPVSVPPTTSVTWSTSSIRPASA